LTHDGHIVAAVSERPVAVNGIELNVLVEGDGPLVVLCHGFPELAFSWRLQVPALVEAGYRVAVPDMRGYGRSSVPATIEDYDIVSLCEDMCGLLDALGERSAVFVGHDWGAIVVWALAILHPERVAAVAGLSVPFLPRAPAPPIELMRKALGEDFYIVQFQQPGVADVALARDVRRTLLMLLTSWSLRISDWDAEDDALPPLPSWLSEEELAVYVEAFERTGFTGGLNWYRNFDRNWELTKFAGERRVGQPAMFLTGERDMVRQFTSAEAMTDWVSDLRASIVVPGAGHWVQQQAPETVNAALLEFLGGL
jgi:pimeloyl-ACP methyl ester carboxylesterase